MNPTHYWIDVYIATPAEGWTSSEYDPDVNHRVTVHNLTGECGKDIPETLTSHCLVAYVRDFGRERCTATTCEQQVFTANYVCKRKAANFTSVTTTASPGTSPSSPLTTTVAMTTTPKNKAVIALFDDDNILMIGILASVVLLIILVTIVVILLCCYCRRRKNSNPPKSLEDDGEPRNVNFYLEMTDKHHTYEQIDMNAAGANSSNKPNKKRKSLLSNTSGADELERLTNQNEDDARREKSVSPIYNVIQENLGSYHELNNTARDKRSSLSSRSSNNSAPAAHQTVPLIVEEPLYNTISKYNPYDFPKSPVRHSYHPYDSPRNILGHKKSSRRKGKDEAKSMSDLDAYTAYDFPKQPYSIPSSLPVIQSEYLSPRTGKNPLYHNIGDKPGDQTAPEQTDGRPDHTYNVPSNIVNYDMPKKARPGKQLKIPAYDNNPNTYATAGNGITLNDVPPSPFSGSQTSPVYNSAYDVPLPQSAESQGTKTPYDVPKSLFLNTPSTHHYDTPASSRTASSVSKNSTISRDSAEYTIPESAVENMYEVLP